MKKVIIGEEEYQGTELYVTADSIRLLDNGNLIIELLGISNWDAISYEGEPDLTKEQELERTIEELEDIIVALVKG